MYINFEKIMEKAKREFKTNKNQRNYIINDIELAKKHILDYIKDNPVEDAEELKTNILRNLYEDSQEFAAISNIKNAVFEYEIINLLIKNPQELEKIYNKVKDEKKEENPYYIDKPFEERKEDFVRVMLNEIIQLKSKNKDVIDIYQRYWKGDKDARDLINKRRKELNIKEREEFEQRVMYLGKDNLEVLKMFMPVYKEYIEKALKKAYIDILNFIGEFFEKNKLMDKYINRNNQQLREIGLPKLCITREDFDENSPFQAEKLEKLKLDELPVMTAFWLNRYTKENQSLNNGIFAINALKLWENILEGKTEFEIDEDQIEALFCKAEFLKAVNVKMTNSVMEKLNNNEANILSKQDDVLSIEVADEINEVEENVRVKYYDEFEGILPTSYSQIVDDLNMYLPLTSNTVNAYDHKDEIITTQILSYMRNNRIRNWGYIENREKNPAVMILGIDYEGYNMPVRLHMHKDQIIKGLKEAGLEAIIPIYEGNNDMVINGKSLNTHIIKPLTKLEENEIKRLMLEKNKPIQVMNFLEHLNFLRDANKYPKHLMMQVAENSWIRHPRKYINLETNEIFIKDQNGNLKKESGEGR